MNNLNLAKLLSTRVACCSGSLAYSAPATTAYPPHQIQKRRSYSCTIGSNSWGGTVMARRLSCNFLHPHSCLYQQYHSRSQPSSNNSWKLLSPQILVRQTQSTSTAISKYNKWRSKRSVKDLVDAAPPTLQPYLRIIRADKPIGTWLLYWPCTWSISLAASPGCFPDFYLLGLFGAGAFFMRGAGCIINDLWDRDIDKMVERTRSRPLASGEMSALGAVSLLGGMLSVSLAILLQLNWLSVGVGVLSMGLVVTYPLAKRYTYWPQIVLGLTFNWGCILGWTAVENSLFLPAVLPLYLSGLFWTLIYDTIYAHQDKTDDLIIGVKSTALRLGEDTRKWLSGFAIATVSGLAAAGYACDQTWPFYLGVSATATHLAWQIGTVNTESTTDCWNKFRSNQWMGLILFLAIVSGNLLKPREQEEPLPETDYDQSTN